MHHRPAPVRQLPDHGRVVDGGSGLFDPDDVSGLLVDRVQVGPDIAGFDAIGNQLVPLHLPTGFFVANLNREDLVADEDGFALAVGVAGERAEITFPDRSAIKVKATHRTAAIEEPDVLAIGDRRKDRRVTENPGGLNRVRPGKVHRPENPAGVRVEAVADEVRLEPIAAFVHRTVRRDKGSVTLNRHRALSALRQGGAPENVFPTRDRPLQGRLGTFRFPIEIRPGRLRPILGTDHGREGEMTQPENSNHVRISLRGPLPESNLAAIFSLMLKRSHGTPETFRRLV